MYGCMHDGLTVLGCSSCCGANDVMIQVVKGIAVEGVGVEETLMNTSSLLAICVNRG